MHPAFNRTFGPYSQYHQQGGLCPPASSSSSTPQNPSFNTTTPYSDALKAVAMPPFTHPMFGAADGSLDKFKRSPLTGSPVSSVSPIAAAAALIPPYWMQALSAHSAYKVRASSPQYPIVYKPKIITQNLQYFSK